jgi:hypothetical protein
MTGDELIRKLFPKRVIKHAKEVANPTEPKKTDRKK